MENCDENSELLTTKGHNLPPIEKQRQYVLRCLVQKNACPNCGHALNFFEGARVDIDDGGNKLGAPFCECNVCKRELIYVVPFLATAGNGGWHWQLVPMDPKR